MNEIKKTRAELLTDDYELGSYLEELNDLKKQMYADQEAAIVKASEPYIERIEELEKLIKVSHRMIS